MSLTKSRIIDRIAEKTSVEKKTAEAMLDCLAQLAYENSKDEFTVPGIGKLVVVDAMLRKMKELDLIWLARITGLGFEACRAGRDAPFSPTVLSRTQDRTGFLGCGFHTSRTTPDPGQRQLDVIVA